MRNNLNILQCKRGKVFDFDLSILVYKRKVRNNPRGGNSMQLKKIWLITFSPTRTSKSAIDALASGIPGIPCENIDLTYSDKIAARQFAADELVIIGVPVYAGRVAPLAVKRLGILRGNNTPAVIVVTYGNRDFEDALIELRDIALKAAFMPIAACTFIGEHSFSGPETPIAAGRPDSVDLATARAFGAKISEKLSALENPETAHCPKVPGNTPYKEGMGPLPFTPSLLESECTQCAACLPICPTGALSLESRIEVDSDLCIFCCACIKVCPENALQLDAEPLRQKRQWLYEHCAERREPELFL